MLRIPPNFVNLQIRPRILLVAVAGSVLAISGAADQENPAGPQAPPPQHKIERVIRVAQPEAPPSLPPVPIINSFTKNEALHFAERSLYTHLRTRRTTEIAHDEYPA